MALLRVIVCLVFCACLNVTQGLTPRYAAIVIDAGSGKVLDEDKADILCHPASLAKIMTLYIVFGALKSGQLTMNTQIPVSAHAARQSPCKLGLRPGERITVATIIKGMVTKSANDASVAIAEYLGGSEANFAAIMTRKAKALGMRNTIFKNASGLPNPYQITTAREMAILSRALYRDFPKDYRHFRLQAFRHRGQLHRNHNHLLGKVSGLDGIKTGYVAASGSNLAASAVRMGSDHKPRRLIVVVLGGPNRYWRDQRVTELLEANFKRLSLAPNESNETFMREEQAESFDRDEVDLFLKEAKAEVSTPSAPSSWPSPQLSIKDPNLFKKIVAKNIQRRKTSGQQVWGVQLGTYRSLGEAKRNVLKTHTIVKTGKIATPQITRGRKTSFGAQLLKLTHQEAQTICKRQRMKGNECRLLVMAN
jgi:D-alanyl-D-alanine carboxypeptidase